MCTLKQHHTIQPFDPIKTDKTSSHPNIYFLVKGKKCNMGTCQRAFVSQDLRIEKCECGWEKQQLPRHLSPLLTVQAALLATQSVRSEAPFLAISAPVFCQIYLCFWKRYDQIEKVALLPRLVTEAPLPSPSLSVSTVGR